MRYLLLFLLIGCFNQVLAQGTPYTYSPHPKDYSITFCKKPAIKAVYFPMGDTIYSGEDALAFEGHGGFERSQHFVFGDIQLIGTDSAAHFMLLKMYAEKEGILYPTFTYEHDDYGYYAEMRGNKRISIDVQKTIMATYVIRVFFSSQSFWCLIVGAPSENFPTYLNRQFLKSRRKA